MSKTFWGALMVTALALPVDARAQGREPATLVSDRPGLGSAAHVLGPGVWQAELGGTIDAQVNDEFLVGSALLRMGFDALELRLVVPSVLVQHQSDFLRLGDLAVGAKVALPLAGDGWRWAALGTLSLPTGSRGASAEDPGVGATFIGETSLSRGVGFAFNAGYGFLTGDVTGGTLSFLATPSFPVPGREGLSMYLGYAGHLRPGDDAHVLEWGLARLDGPDRQWDVNAGYDPGGHTWFLGVGVSQRRR